MNIAAVHCTTYWTLEFGSQKFIVIITPFLSSRRTLSLEWLLLSLLPNAHFSVWTVVNRPLFYLNKQSLADYNTLQYFDDIFYNTLIVRRAVSADTSAVGSPEARMASYLPVQGGRKPMNTDNVDVICGVK